MAGLRIACFLAMCSVARATTAEPEPDMVLAEPEPGSGDQIVTGSAFMTIADVAAFMADGQAKLAVRKAIAAEANGIAVDKVAAEFFPTRRLEALKAEEETEKENPRRLASGTVRVDYTITLPVTMSSADQAAALSKIKTITKESLTEAIKTEMTAMSLSHDVTVDSFTYKIHGATDPTETSDAKKFAQICWSAVFLLFSTVFTA